MLNLTSEADVRFKLRARRDPDLNAMLKYKSQTHWISHLNVQPETVHAEHAFGTN
jgi:hypothetical protein